MSAFIIIHSTITAPELFQKYVEASEHSLDIYKGKFLMGGMVSDVLEGNHNQKRTVIFEFPDVDQARGWYNSDEYRATKHLKDGTGTFDFVLIDSF